MYGDTSAAYKRHYQVFGQPHRERTFKEVHEAIQRMEARNMEILEQHKEWFKSCPKFFIADNSAEPGQYPVIGYDIDPKRGALSNWYTDMKKKDRDWAKAIRDPELPLMLNDLDTYSKEVQYVINQRLKGERSEPEIRQDLHDRKVLIDKKWKRIRLLHDSLMMILKQYVLDIKYKVPRGLDYIKLYTLEIEGTDYVFEADNTGVRYVSKGETVRLKLE